MQAATNAPTLRSIQSTKAYRAHDLIRLRALPLADDAPEWLASAFAQAPFSVVRRAEAPSGFVAVGFRGSARSHRYGTFVATDSVLADWSPESLLHRHARSERETLRAFAAFRQLVEERTFDSLVWGPTGSVGFELAAEWAAVTDTSDLDVLVRAPSPLTRAHARSLRARLETIERDRGLRIDVQLETPAGGVALAEWSEDKPRVMVRSARGPSLVADPWALSALTCEANR